MSASPEAASGVRNIECPACGAPVDRDANDPEIAGLIPCAACGLRWERILPSGEELARSYQTGFYEAAAPRGGRLTKAFHAFNSTLRLRELRGMPPGRLLDLGCGKGHFVAAARRVGWDAIGTDHSPAAAAAARQLYGIEIIVGDVTEVALDGPFDAVTMWHMLEHVPDPAGVLRRSRELLAPGGRLVVSVPNLASAQARTFGPDWFHLDREHHAFHFTPVALNRLLEREGFVVERIGYLYPEMEAIGLVQSVLNRAGLRRDELYRFMKRDRTVRADRSLLAAAGLAAAATPFALSASIVMPLLRSGASMQFVAHLDH